MLAASTASIWSTVESGGSDRSASRSGWSRVITPMERRMRSSLLAPKPDTRRSRPARTAASRSAMEATPSSRLSCSARLGPMPGTVAISCTPGRDLRPQLVHGGDGAGPPELGDLAGDGGAHAIDLGQRRVGYRAEVTRVPADGLGRLLVVPRPELVPAGDGEQFRVLPQQRRNVVVGPCHVLNYGRVSMLGRAWVTRRWRAPGRWRGPAGPGGSACGRGSRSRAGTAAAPCRRVCRRCPR